MYYTDLRQLRPGDRARHRRPAPGSAVGPVPVFARDEKFRVELAEGARWATAKDFGAGAVAELRAACANASVPSSSSSITTATASRTCSCSVPSWRSGQVRDLLLHNEGGGQFRDVTAAGGTWPARPSLGCCVGDFDNDGYPDLLITGAGRLWLFRNNRQGRLRGRQRGAPGWTRRAASTSGPRSSISTRTATSTCSWPSTPIPPTTPLPPSRGRRRNRRAGSPSSSTWAKSLVANLNADPPPLKPKFKAADLPGIDATGLSAVGIALSDVDLDFDLDALLLADDRRPKLVLNDRLLPLPYRRVAREGRRRRRGGMGRWSST